LALIRLVSRWGDAQRRPGCGWAPQSGAGRSRRPARLW